MENIVLIVLIILSAASIIIQNAGNKKLIKNVTKENNHFNETNTNLIKSMAKKVKLMTPNKFINLNYNIDNPFLKISFLDEDGKSKYAWFLLDTGADKNLIDSTFLSQIKYTKTNKLFEASGFAGKQNIYEVTTTGSISKDNSLVYNFNFLASDLKDTVEYYSHKNIVFGGTIGIEFMNNHGWFIDNSKKKLKIYPL